MKMTHETDVLKAENPDLLALLQEMQHTVCEAAHQGTPIDIRVTIAPQAVRYHPK